MKQQSILYNTTTNEPISAIMPDLYSVLYPQGILKDDEINLIVVNTPAPAYDQLTERLIQDGYIREGNNWVRQWRVEPLTDYELALRDWTQPESKLRIVAPIQLVLDEIGNRMETWFRITDLHIEKRNGFIYVYCEKILPEHQEIYDQYAGIVEVQNRPEILNNEMAQ